MYRMMETDPNRKPNRGRHMEEDGDDPPLRPPPRLPKGREGFEKNAIVPKSSSTSEKENHDQTTNINNGDLPSQPSPIIATTTKEKIDSPSSAAKPTFRPAYQRTLSSSDEIVEHNNNESTTKVHASKTEESSATKDGHKISNVAAHPRGSSPPPTTTTAAAAAANAKGDKTDGPQNMSASGKEKWLAVNHHHHHHEEMKEQDNHGKNWSEKSLRQQPGAFNVHGSKTEKQTTGFISPHVEQQQEEMQQTTTVVAAASVTPVQSLPQSTATVTPRPQEEEVFTVVAKVTTECEIEEQVRQRIFQEAVQADVVLTTATAENSSPSDHNNDQGTIASSTTNSSTTSKAGFKTKLFGTGHTAVDISASPEAIRKRDLLEWSVTYSTKTNAWIASVHTNQRALDANDTVEATKAIQTFSSTTKRRAEEVGIAMAPPRMLPFSENPACFICGGTFAVFRRASHCRNCGVCVCSSCSTSWPSSMIPDTYNIKNESRVTICKACNWSNASFRDALLCGKYDQVVSLYTTGNINLTRPFSNARGGEVARPIHCAIKGGNLRILQWLIEERCCPIRHPLQTNKNGKIRDLGPIRTSKKRSLLNIAMSDHKLDFVRYLVADQNMSLFEERGLNPKNALQNFTVLLQMLPENFFVGRQSELHQLLTEVQSASFGQPMTMFDAAPSTVGSNSVVDVRSNGVADVILQDNNNNYDQNLDGFEEENDKKDEKVLRTRRLSEF